MLNWEKLVSIIIIGFYLLVTQGLGTSALNCVYCYSRNHPGCVNLDSPVFIEECFKDEVCTKFTSFKTARSSWLESNQEVIGVIRGCTKYVPEIGLGFNSCIRAEGVRTEDRCYCNDTDQCNGTGGPRHKSSFHHVHILFLGIIIGQIYSWFNDYILNAAIV